MHWLARHRILFVAGICAFCTGIIFLGRILPGVPFLFSPWSGQQSFEDMLRRDGWKTATRSDLVFVGIDQQSLQLDAVGPEEIASERALQLMTERPFPWSRALWSLLLDKLFASGARLVMFDMVFNPPNDGDSEFQAALEKHRDRVVLGCNFDTARGNQLIVPNTALIPTPQAQDDRVGFVNFWPDATDGKVRAVRFTVSERQLAGQSPFPGEEMFRSLSARALEKLGRPADAPFDLTPRAIRFGAADAYEPRALYEIFVPATWHSNYADGAFFKNKVVMVGASAQILHDVVDTPLDPSMHGPALHLHAMAAAMAHEFLTSTSPALGYTLVGAAGALAWLLIAFIRRPVVCITLLSAVVVAYLGAARMDMIGSGCFFSSCGPERVCGERFGFVRFRICAGTHREDAHPPHARTLRFEKSRERNSR